VKITVDFENGAEPVVYPAVQQFFMAGTQELAGVFRRSHGHDVNLLIGLAHAELEWLRDIKSGALKPTVIDDGPGKH